ncbi:kinase domain protein [Ceratobasidium sp. AG-Ba]|nr:kinase domain protein [Ceratobasidium sp. AG-Ba]
MSPIPLEHEIRDHIFCDPSFVERFLTGDKDKLRAVVQRCHKSTLFSKRRWTLPKLKQGGRLYPPIVRVLNTIAEAVSAGRCSRAHDSFLHYNPRMIKSDFELSFLTDPDLVLFDNKYEQQEHWETVRMTVRVKRLKSHLKAAIAGLAFDARAIFAHQIHRRHLYALAICGTEATFVRFDRAGVLYSTPIDVSRDSDGFTKAVAALLLMDKETFGYDPIFSTKMGSDGRLDYYVELPHSALDEPGSLSQATKSPDVRLKVTEVLCHRQDIVGRATIVLRLQKVKVLDVQLGSPAFRTRGQKRKFEESQPEELHDVSFVLKLVWRDPSQEPEGEVLKKLVGIYGLVQYAWHGDASRACKRGCFASSLCGRCVDETPRVDEMFVCQNLSNIQGAIRIIGNGGEYTCEAINTKKLERTTQGRRRRIYSRTLLSSVGKMLWAAEGPKELLMGILDALMGCWHLVNMNILHRDISGGNIMLLPPGQKLRWREWKGPFEHGTENPTDSNCKLREYLDRFDRNPTGMLSDFDMYQQLSDGESSFSASSESGDSTGSADDAGGVHRPRISLAPSPEETRDENGMPHAKRRKTECSYVAASSKCPKTDRVARVPGCHRAPRYGPSTEKVDYRVGTIAFMSINVLNVAPGEQYEHSFMDDLESFFWVLLYAMLGHADPPVKILNPAAVGMLDRLDDDDMSRVRAFKVECLVQCCRLPEEMIKKLRSTENSWAYNEALSQALIRLGSFFCDEDDTPLSQMTPADAFPKVVDIFIEALQELDQP